MKKVSYVAGFLFTDEGDQVLLIEKQRPAWQKGRLNGIGGHIEENETSIDAMRREFKEETGVGIDGWKRFVTLSGQSDVTWTVDFFLCFDTKSFQKARCMTDERIFEVRTELLGEMNILTNLQWLIPMALSMKEEFAIGFMIEEIYSPNQS